MDNNSNNSLSAFWKRPEGKLGMPALIAMFGVGAYFLYKALPTLITLMENTFYALGLFAGLVAIFALVLNGRFRTTVWYLYKGLMRAITGLAIELNPIAILESYVEDIKAKLVKIGEQMKDLKGQMGKIFKKIEDKKTEYRLAVDRMRAVANNPDKKGELLMFSRQSERLKVYIEKLEKLYTRMEILYNVLKKMEYYSGIMVQDTDMQVQLAKDEREAITKSHSVMKSAMNIIKGNNDRKMIFDQSMEFVLDDIGYKVGEMDRMLEESTQFISEVDIDDEVYAERGLKMLEKFDQNGIDAIFGNKPTQNTSQQALSGNVPNYLDVNQISKPVPTPLNNTTDKKKYFN